MMTLNSCSTAEMSVPAALDVTVSMMLSPVTLVLYCTNNNYCTNNCTIVELHL